MIKMFKKMSVLKVLRAIVAIVFFIQLVNLFFGKRFGENGERIFMGTITGLFAVILILAFGFGKKLEQEKIEREERGA
jgi:uncharacterized membrane protein